jgi:hypothetical protein
MPHHRKAPTVSSNALVQETNNRTMKTKIITTVFLVSALLTSALAQDNEVPQEVVERVTHSPGGFGHLEFVKEINVDFLTNSQSKLLAVPPVGKGFGFSACDGDYTTPPDGTIAVSNSGTIICASNTDIEFRNTSGTILSAKLKWGSFLYGAPSSNLQIFDPELIYDNLKNRFILVIVETEEDAVRNSNNTGKIHVLFSKSASSNPNQWYHYKFRGDTVILDSSNKCNVC